MFRLKKITKVDFDKFYSLLEKDFCFAERKTKEDEFETLKNSKFSANFIYHNDLLIGYICFWDFEEFLYIEHFAIIEELRNQYWGTKFLKEFVLNNLKY